MRNSSDRGSSGRSSRHPQRRERGRLLAILPLLILLAGCSSLSNLFGSNDDDMGPELPADKLYNEGVYLLNEKGSAKEAVKKFEEVDRQHPYSDWARKSLLMTAYSYYETKQYEEAIGAAKRYVSMHPGSPDVAYAQYLIGASHYDQIPDVTRDQTRTERAIQALEEVIRKYPTSEYAQQARKKIEVGRDHLAAKEMAVARYYMEKKNFIGAINRFKVVVTQYQTTRHVEEALMRLTECYMMLGIANEAQTAAAVLGHNFPDSPWYKDAYRLVKGGGFEPSENKGSWISRAFKKVGLG
ncbi:outer membrane protein assembly factor BamD [Rhodoplanes serenus]|uniref:Outer membrane protein assembly factor BamD n=1 Tax=Rhodoplanes serenus TaxID=200615 RepID=A0A9X4XKR3_9BRAD|nr:outer membrane protein assembly factor BamD [Rhodoplanes serenus]